MELVEIRQTVTERGIFFSKTDIEEYLECDTISLVRLTNNVGVAEYCYKGEDVYLSYAGLSILKRYGLSGSKYNILVRFMFELAREKYEAKLK